MKLKIFFLLVYVAFLLLVVEGFFRLIDFDFDRSLRLYYKIPIYWRVPKDPVCEVYFKRHGPEEWSGKILQQYAREVYNDQKAHLDEKSVTVTYDRDGFRNPNDLKDWKIAVAGDSFTESGFLPYESLLPTRLGQLLNVPVKNLGVTYTSTFTQVCYLKNFGIAPSTQHAVLAFFEDNDIDEMKDEHAALEKYLETGEKPYREMKNFKQTSFLKSIKILVSDFLFREIKGRQVSADFYDAYFMAGNDSIRIHAGTPPNPLDSTELKLLDEALALWSNTSKEKNLTPWLLCIPGKYRVLKGFLELPDGKQEFADSILLTYKVPEQIKGICEKYEIRYLDAMDTLRKETEKGILTYNTLYDSHLNEHGLEVVAAKLANFMRPVVRPESAITN